MLLLYGMFSEDLKPNRQNKLVQDFLALKLSALPLYKAGCMCGVSHSMQTLSIEFGKGILDKLPDFMLQFVPTLARILVISDSYSEEAGGRAAIKKLAKSGYRIATHIYKDAPEGNLMEANQISIPEDCMLVVGIGGASIAEIVKFVATKENKPCVIILNSVAASRVLAPASCLVDDNGLEQTIQVTPPVGLFCDADNLRYVCDKFIASSFGELMAKYISLFDYKAASVINKEPFCDTAYNIGIAILDDLISTFADSKEKICIEKLALSSIKFGALSQWLDNNRLFCGSDTACGHVAKILFKYEQRKSRRRGEFEFMFARVVQCIYKSFLEGEIRGFIPPPDNNMRLDRIEEFLGLKESVAIEKIRPILTPLSTTLAKYRLDEYKADLLAACNQNTNRLVAAFKIFKRLYDDDGYNLINVLDESSSGLCVSLAPDLKSGFTFLSYLKDMGHLDEFIEDLI